VDPILSKIPTKLAKKSPEGNCMQCYPLDSRDESAKGRLIWNVREKWVGLGFVTQEEVHCEAYKIN
jgi:hypothetical protein